MKKIEAVLDVQIDALGVHKSYNLLEHAKFINNINEDPMVLLVMIKEKILQKGCDFLFANPIDLEGQGFGFLAQNEGWLFDTNNLEHYINKTSKIDLANKLITQIISLKK